MTDLIFHHNASYLTSRWKYQTSDQLKGAPYSGQIGVTYSGAGSVQDLSSLKDETAKIIK